VQNGLIHKLHRNEKFCVPFIKKDANNFSWPKKPPSPLPRKNRLRKPSQKRKLLRKRRSNSSWFAAGKLSLGRLRLNSFNISAA
jgi:hypothetical protein